jgi:hypothetical protein
MPCAALVRHPATSCAALRGIEAVVTCTAGTDLQVSFSLVGDIDRLRIPSARTPRVAERLWQHTCCEVFIARPGTQRYREFNLSPSGEWAAYEFARYREGEPLAVASPGIVVREEPGRLELRASLCVERGEKLLLGLSAVVEELDGNLSYWALRHAPGKPDFHHADTFALELDEVRD